jgi:hypothetical protein
MLVGSAAVLSVAARHLPRAAKHGPVGTAVTATMTTSSSAGRVSAPTAAPANEVAGEVKAALDAFSATVRPLSSPQALDDAFRSYFTFKAAHPEQVKNSYLYFVDYGLPSTTTRGYVFDMQSLKIVDGPFTVAHGRGSSTSQYGVPTRFSNDSRSEATSLGLYVTENVYPFHGHEGGTGYTSIGLKLQGVSTGFNDNAGARGVVAHGAPYVTPTRAGRSEGCPAMEPERAQRLLPMLANGGMAFLFAPDPSWLAGDPWLAASANLASQ